MLGLLLGAARHVVDRTQRAVVRRRWSRAETAAAWSVRDGEDGEMFADTPEPPYVAVVFTSERQAGDDESYEAASVAMVALASEQPGFLGVESVRDASTRLGITVSYWRTDLDARAWKRVAEHLVAQRLGRERWYSRYAVRVATVERAYGSGS